jgi:hypothetical protein
VLFVVDSFIPDMIPFVDEILLGLGAALLGSWKRRKESWPRLFGQYFHGDKWRPAG